MTEQQTNQHAKLPQHQAEKKPYNSNPFTLSFDALGKLFTHNLTWAIVLLVLGAISAFGQLASNAFGNINSSSTSPNYETNITSGSSLDATTVIAIVIVVFVVALILLTVILVVDTYVKGMLSYVALKSEDGESVSFSEAFNETASRFWRLLGAQLLAGLKILGWGLLFIIPGIVAALKYSMLPYEIMRASKDEKGASSAHSNVKALTKGRVIEIFGVATVSSIIPFVGSLLALTGHAAQYDQLNYYYKHKLEKPKVHWLNYLGFILIALILPILFLIGLLALALGKW